MKIFGLIGKNIEYSFSKQFFIKKFKEEKIFNCKYEIFDIKNISMIKNIFKNNSNLLGLNVTIPYKEKIIKYLSSLSREALKIGAVNTIKIKSNNKYIGYNTDIYGFEKSFIKHLKIYHKKALVLGTGGASKAISFVLNKLNISHKLVSRKESKNTIFYSEINKYIMDNYNIIINCTPLGTFPLLNKTYPKIPYDYLSNKHYLYDLVYNPSETIFLKKGIEKGCIIQNGLDMLYEQANISWNIWNS